MAKTRQSVRKGIILLSFALFPITIFYLSPVLALHGAFTGALNGALLLFAAQFAFSLVLGRAFCGWVCPGSGAGEACRLIRSKPVARGRYDKVKYLLWVPWIAAIAVFAMKAGGFHTFDPLANTRSGISVTEPQHYVIYYGVLALIVLPALIIGRMGFCHAICWMAPFMVIGTRIRDMLRLPGLRLRATPEVCRECSLCDVACPMSLDVSGMVKSGSMRNSECTLCGSCVDACSRSAISYSFGPPEKPYRPALGERASGV